ncbi:hypothetical protein [Tabrizicola sp.]|uniref:hypothetical protein n=1 Tax=Tabrizicola sp. TaxID=2005166 RepID=UPI002869FA48|nr:hypothetical protein [Tabrizicola sp.]
MQNFLGTKLQLRIVPSIDGQARTWLNRVTGAAVRAFLVMILIVMPSVILPGIGTDTKQIVALMALFAGALVFVEYNAVYPSLVEFRDGAPFNRIRYLMLLAIIIMLSVIVADREDPTTVSRLFRAVGVLIGQSLDFPYSPVRLATFLMSDNASAAELMEVRTAAGTAYFLSILSLAVFVVVLKLAGWPSTKSAFNVWVNLPTFEPTAGGDVIDRLERDARFNLAMGFLLPFLIPTLVALGTAGLPPATLTSPQTLIWAMAAWAFLPASLLMRGVAMGRIADMIRMKRDRNIADDPALAPLANH